ncbi:YggU family protein [Deltaproteobacteria bacterium Smac51]|nr:YggU family protein [Deltaproteobacteria bacterium Smac51]
MASDSVAAVHLRVLLSPRAGKDALVGMQGEDLKIRIAAPPVDGAANAALVKFLAKTLGVTSDRISLVAGQTGRRKIVKIEGLTESQLWAALDIR